MSDGILRVPANQGMLALRKQALRNAGTTKSAFAPRKHVRSQKLCAGTVLPWFLREPGRTGLATCRAKPGRYHHSPSVSSLVSFWSLRMILMMTLSPGRFLAIIARRPSKSVTFLLSYS